MSAARAALLSLVGASAIAAEPTLSHLYPASGGRGGTVNVSASGKFDPWPAQIWVDAAGITFEPGRKTGEYVVKIAPDAPLGPHLVRAFNDRGASAPRFFIVGPSPEALDAEPNDHFASAQKIPKLPATLSGRLNKAGDVDCFAVTLRKGQRLTASLEAYVLASTFDGLLRIVDERGGVLAFAHDGRALDPVLRWSAPHDGTFVVQVMGFVYPATASVSLTGGEGCVYRLQLSDATEPPLEVSEREPNNAREAAPALDLPASAIGRIDGPDDEDRFAFTAVKKRAYELKVAASARRSALDAWLKIEDASGKQLARSDDADGSRDPKLVWTAPDDGRYFAVIGDLTHRGGADYHYALSIDEARPSLTASSTKHSLVLEAGKPAELKFTLARAQGFSAAIEVHAKNLPTGVTLEPVSIPKKDGEITARFTATAEAAAANQPFQLCLRETDGTEHRVVHRMITTGENNGVPNGYTELVIPSTDQLWLTVIPAPPNPQEPKPAEPKANE